MIRGILMQRSVADIAELLKLRQSRGRDARTAHSATWFYYTAYPD